KWDRYDNLVRVADQLGLSILFTITGPAPAWATKGGPRKPNVFRPDPAAFRDFVTAVGLRYSGAYPDEPDPTGPSRVGGLVIGGLTIGGRAADPPAPGGILPRVTHWSIWNEPNFPGWLAPGWQRVRSRDPRHMVASSPLP